MSSTEVSEYLKATDQTLSDVQYQYSEEAYAREKCDEDKVRCQRAATRNFEEEMDDYRWSEPNWALVWNQLPRTTQGSEKLGAAISADRRASKEDWDAYLQHHRDKMDSSHKSCQAVHDTCMENVNKNKQAGKYADPALNYPKKLTDAAAEFDAEAYYPHTDMALIAGLSRPGGRKGQKKTKKGRKRKRKTKKM